MYNTIHAKNPFLLYLKAMRESVHAKESVHVPSVKQSFNVPDKIVSIYHNNSYISIVLYESYIR
jgi:hypothetical protein